MSTETTIETNVSVTTAVVAAATDSTGPYVYLVFLCILIVSITVSNSLVLIAVNRYHSLQTVTNQYVISLSVADLLVGIGLVCWLIMDMVSWYAQWQPPDYICFFRTGLALVTIVVSMLNVLAIAVDRYVAIIYPFVYNTHMTYRVANTVIAGLWTYAILLFAIPAGLSADRDAGCHFESFVNKYHILAYCIHYIITFVVMLCLYSKIFAVSWHQMREIQRLRISAPAGDGRRDHHDLASLKQTMRTVRVFLMVFGILFTCLTPFYVLYTMLAFTELNVESGPTYMFNLTQTADALLFANSTMNPFIYAWKYREFKVAFKKLLGCYRFDGYSSNSYTFRESTYTNRNGAHEGAA
ncbi:PREDICTED: octopamine receptor 1-like [Priapulus caudatus]|uniref:Octopamine receptor 1-like n=1 Tax=Priapulus caudatus TaxID=37621 RepID=A0ABM1EJY9_PRICU|nr:PREDICTED: octopamine receptor 1-like [Priapulus caudatus]